MEIFKRLVKSKLAPDDKYVVWIDISYATPVLKIYKGEQWVAISNAAIPIELIRVIVLLVIHDYTYTREEVRDLIKNNFPKEDIESLTAEIAETKQKASGWYIEKLDPTEDEPTVRAKYVLKNPYVTENSNNSTIKIYKDTAITNVYVGDIEDDFNENTGEVILAHPEEKLPALCIVYHIENGKYKLVKIPIDKFFQEAKFDKYRGLGVDESGLVFIKLAKDSYTSAHISFNDAGEIVLKDVGGSSNVVTLDTSLTITGKKSFTKEVSVSGNLYSTFTNNDTSMVVMLNTTTATGTSLGVAFKDNPRTVFGYDDTTKISYIYDTNSNKTLGITEAGKVILKSNIKDPNTTATLIISSDDLYNEAIEIFK